ncbi:hypothetical protein C8F01DRAFT_1129435 [Mycena amicta]|nr:hypothetical protein C8F01DRAFT_1129435 [Mycena amicta]
MPKGANSEVELEAARRSLEIDGALRAQWEAEKTLYKVLVVGTPRQAASRFVGCLRVCYGDDLEERKRFQARIVSHCIHAARESASAVLRASSDGTMIQCCRTILSNNTAPTSTEDFWLAVQHLWTFNTLFRNFVIAKYAPLANCFDTIDRISEPDYEPTNSEIISVALRDTRISDADPHEPPSPPIDSFVTPGLWKWRFTAIHQRIESPMRRWLHLFDRVACAVVVVDVADYDRPDFIREATDLIQTVSSAVAGEPPGQNYYPTLIVLFDIPSTLRTNLVLSPPSAQAFPGYEHDPTRALEDEFVAYLNTRVICAHLDAMFPKRSICELRVRIAELGSEEGVKGTSISASFREG